MTFVLIYATTEGQTLKIARFAAERLREGGHSVELMPAEAALAAPLDLGAEDKVLLLGSVHMGAYQEALVRFATAQRGALGRAKAGFVSVSLVAAGDDPDDWDGLKDCVERFIAQTGWHPAFVHHLAGAFRFTQYDFFKSFAMRMIARQKGVKVDAQADTEFTDWEAFGGFVDAWAREAPPEAA